MPIGTMLSKSVDLKKKSDLTGDCTWQRALWEPTTYQSLCFCSNETCAPHFDLLRRIPTHKCLKLCAYTSAGTSESAQTGLEEMPLMFKVQRPLPPVGLMYLRKGTINREKLMRSFVATSHMVRIVVEINLASLIGTMSLARKLVSDTMLLRSLNPLGVGMKAT